MATAYLITLLLSLTMTSMFAIYAWMRRTHPGAKAFAAFMVSTAVTTLTFIGQHFAPTQEISFFWVRMRYFGSTIFPVTYLIFVLEYIGQYDWLTPRRLALLLVIPAITLLLVWTNDLHHLFWTDWRAVPREGLMLEVPRYAIGFGVHGVFLYGLIAVGSFLLFVQFARAAPSYRVQVQLQLLGILAAMAGYLPGALNLAPSPIPSLTPVGFTVMGLLFGWAMFRYKLLNLMPIAHATIFRSLTDAVVVLDDQSRVIEMNPEALRRLGKPELSVIGQPVNLVFAAYPTLLTRYANVLEKHDEFTIGEGLQERTYDVWITPLRNARNEVAGRLVTFRDITEQQRLIAALGGYADTVAHDLKNPIQSIMGYAEMLQTADNYESQEAQTMLKRIMDISLRMSESIDDLLLFARVRSTEEIQRERVDMNALVQNVLRNLDQMIVNTDTEVTLQSLPNARGYAPWIEAVWANYLSNAIKYGGQPPRLVIGGEAQGTTVRYHVRDNGPGLSAEEQERLFTRFTRLEKHAHVKGHGIGLALVREIVEHLGGRVGVESTVGQGSSFYFTLPAQEN